MEAGSPVTHLLWWFASLLHEEGTDDHHDMLTSLTLLEAPPQREEGSLSVRGCSNNVTYFSISEQTLTLTFFVDIGEPLDAVTLSFLGNC